MTARDRFLAKAGRFAGIALAMAGAVALCVFVRFVYVGLTAQRQFATAREVVIADARKTGIDAIRIVTPANHLLITQPDGSVNSAITIDGREVMPLAGVSHHVTLLCNENGQWVNYHSDRRGFNNQDEIWQFRDLDVAALGDSFAHGYCVPRHQNFVDLIRQRGIGTLNLAMAGHGPLLMLATLKEHLPALAPKILLWFYFEGNDLINLQTERRSALLRRYLTDNVVQPDLARQREIDQAILAEIPRLDAEEQELAEKRRRKPPLFGLLDSVKLTSIRERLAPLADSDPHMKAVAADFATANMEVFREALKQAKTRTEAWNGHFYFVYLPEWSRYTGYGSWGKARRSEVLQLVNDLGIPIIDIDPVFQAHGDPLSLFPFRGVGHYNEAGHRLVAAEVFRHLKPSDVDGSD